MWQAQKFANEQQDIALAEALQWLNDHEDIIIEFSAAVACEPDGTHVCVVKYRARGIRPWFFPNNEI